MNIVGKIILREVVRSKCNPFLLNQEGYYDDLATVVIEELSEATKECTEKYADLDQYGSHVWIKYHDKHYDAECYIGVSDYRELPFFKRWKQYIRSGKWIKELNEHND